MTIAAEGSIHERDILLEEFKNALGHIRHLEQERRLYLTLLLTVLIASMGWVFSGPGPVEKLVESPTTAIYFPSFILVIFSWIIFFLIKKLGSVMIFHQRTVTSVRHMLNSPFDVPQQNDVMRISVHVLTECIVVFVSLFLIIAPSVFVLCSLWANFENEKHNLWYLIVYAFEFTVSMAFFKSRICSWICNDKCSKY